MSAYDYVKTQLVSSGIDFGQVTKNDMLKTCSEYKGAISAANCEVIARVINDIYDSMQACV